MQGRCLLPQISYSKQRSKGMGSNGAVCSFCNLDSQVLAPPHHAPGQAGCKTFSSPPRERRVSMGAGAALPKARGRQRGKSTGGSPGIQFPGLLSLTLPLTYQRGTRCLGLDPCTTQPAQSRCTQTPTFSSGLARHPGLLAEEPFLSLTLELPSRATQRAGDV